MRLIIVWYGSKLNIKFAIDSTQLAAIVGISLKLLEITSFSTKVGYFIASSVAN